MTLIGVPRENAPGERRVALVPKVVERLRGLGVSVVVEAGAGAGALIPDEHYLEAGATIGDPWPADVVVKVNPPTEDEISMLKPGSIVTGFLAPRTRPDIAGRLRLAGVTGFAMEAVPRISRAQTMDALSSQANVAGYKAAKDAARLANDGYYPTSQSWAQGQWGCGAWLVAVLLFFVLIGILVFIYMVIVKPDGACRTCTRRRHSRSQRPVGAAAAGCSGSSRSRPHGRRRSRRSRLSQPRGCRRHPPLSASTFLLRARLPSR